jgi:hypothetical protein
MYLFILFIAAIFSVKGQGDPVSYACNMACITAATYYYNIDDCTIVESSTPQCSRIRSNCSHSCYITALAANYYIGAYWYPTDKGNTPSDFKKGEGKSEGGKGTKEKEGR